MADVDGSVYSAGDADVEFSIQSISKAFVYALVCEQRGRELVRERIGVNNTGLPFNSVIAIEFNRGHPTNPMVNAGAIATTSLVQGRTPNSKYSGITSRPDSPSSRAARCNSMRSCTAQHGHSVTS